MDLTVALSLGFIFTVLFLFFYYFGKGFWDAVKIFLLVLLMIPFLPLIIFFCIYYDDKNEKARKNRRKRLQIEKMNKIT